MSEYDTYIDAICEKDELGTLPPLDTVPEHDVDSDTWGLYFEYSDPYSGNNDMVCLHFENKDDAIATSNKILSDRAIAQAELEKVKKSLTQTKKNETILA